MFRFHKTVNVITLFHKPSFAPSTRVLNLLKQTSAAPTAGAAEDQASGHSVQTNLQPIQFELDVTEEPPTPDQLRNILEYVGESEAGSVVEGARDAADAIRKVREDGKRFRRPVVVDWDNGKAVIGESESAILKMVNALPKAN